MNCKLFKDNQLDKINEFMKGKTIEKLSPLGDCIAVFWYKPYNDKEVSEKDVIQKEVID